MAGLITLLANVQFRASGSESKSAISVTFHDFTWHIPAHEVTCDVDRN